MYFEKMFQYTFFKKKVELHYQNFKEQSIFRANNVGLERKHLMKLPMTAIISTYINHLLPGYYLSATDEKLHFRNKFYTFLEILKKFLHFRNRFLLHISSDS